MGVADEVKSRIDIVELISGYVPLKKSGRSYKGLCPFHVEKTPSFVVFPDRQTWRCFGACGTGGDVFDFLMQREGMDFLEALRELAQRVGVPLSSPTPQSEAADKQQEKLLEIHKAAAHYFHHLLRQSKEGARAREYVAGRGINSETLERFLLGYALNTWDGLKTYLTGKGYAEADLVQAGLVVVKEETGSSYDRFRDRLIIPIRDVRGRVIAFGARALNPNDVPKYLNSPQTPLFDKSSTLFGLDIAKQGIRDTDRAIIVEGYMDVLSAYQHEHRNVVAGMGTALTETQLKRLKRYTKNFVLALDADTAGDAATLRGINLAREALDRQTVPVPTAQGLIRFESQLDADIRIATLPPGRDPDDILRETPDLWPEIVDGALPVVDFYLKVVSSQYDLTTAKGKSALVRQVLPLLKEISSGVERAHYVGQLARMVRIEERLLLADLEGGPRPATAPPQAPPARPPAEDAGQTVDRAADKRHGGAGQEQHLLAVVLRQPGTLAAANEELMALDLAPLSAEDFGQGDNRRLFQMVLAWEASGGGSPEGFVDQVDPLFQSQVKGLNDYWSRLPVAPAETLGKELVNLILRLRDQTLKEEVSNLRFLQREAEEDRDEAQVLHYQKLANAAKEKLRLVQQAVYRRSIMGRRHAEAGALGLKNH